MCLGFNRSFFPMFSEFQAAENRVSGTVQNAADSCFMQYLQSFTATLCRKGTLLLSWKGNSEPLMSFQQIATKMALVSANV